MKRVKILLLYGQNWTSATVTTIFRGLKLHFEPV